MAGALARRMLARAGSVVGPVPLRAAFAGALVAASLSAWAGQAVVPEAGAATGAVAAAPGVAPGACGKVLLAATAWLSALGGGVTVKSNGPTEGTGASCGGTKTSDENSVKGIVTGFKWQCVELVNRLYVTKGWIDATWHGNGGTTVQGDHTSMYYTAPPNLTKSLQGSISYVAPGDVVLINLFDNNVFVPDGHALIVNSAGKLTSGSVPLVSQNSGSPTAAEPKTTGHLSSGTLTIPSQGTWRYTVIGVVHAPSSAPTTGSITGTVTDNLSPANDLGGITVKASGAGSGTAVTAANGTYTISGLPAGSYDVQFTGGTSYVTQWYSGATTLGAATPVSVSAGATTANVDAALPHQTAISGTVTNTASPPSPLPTICVEASAVSGGGGGYATTAANGSYTIDNLSAGTYQVHFTGCGQNYVSQWYSGRHTSKTATVVTVNPGETTGNIGVAMAVGGKMSGKVTSAATPSSAVSGACVSATSLGGTYSGSATTAANGTYTIVGLGTGKYHVEFTGCGQNYVTQWYKNKKTVQGAASVAVTQGSTTGSVNAALATGGIITGTVTSSATSSSGIGNICVDAGGPTSSGTARTTANGSYRIVGLASGTYTVKFTSCGQDVVTQWYEDASSQTTATPVPVTAGTTTPGIDAKMVPVGSGSGYGSITGTVTNEASPPVALAGVCVLVAALTGDQSWGATTSASGAYRVTALTPGSYDVSFSTCTGGDYLPQWYDGASSMAAATAVTVTAGTTTAGIDAALTTGGSVSGTVTTAGTPPSDVAGVCVYAYDSTGPVASTTTAPDGTYILRSLASGAYDIEFSSCNPTENYATQWYDDASSEATATAVSVTVGTTTSGIDAVLVPDGSIAGTVTSASTPSSGLGGICVDAYGPTGARGYATTATSGAYTVTGLPAGQYYVQFTGCGQNYAPQWYDGSSSFAGSSPVSVTLGTTTSGVDAAMTAGGSISGTVASASSPSKHLGGVTVDASGPTGLAGSSTTAADGTYTITGLGSGSYDVEFLPYGKNYLSQWYSGATTETAASPVAVTAGATTPGINAALVTGGSVTGRVTNTASPPTGLSGICVYVNSSTPTGPGTLTTTGAAGTYDAKGLPSGSYYVQFSTCDYESRTYVTQWYSDASSRTAATLVSVTEGVQTSGIDAAMVTGGSISGTVSSSAAPTTGLAGVCVTAQEATGGFNSGYAQTAANGTYTVSGLPAGSYDVEFTDCSDPGGYARQWYDGQRTQGDANAVSVQEGATTSGVDATLVVAGSISGTVASGGIGLSGICVEASVTDPYQYGGSALTSTSGTYTISGLSPGRYDVEFTDCSNPGNYVAQWYDGASTQSDATAVQVTGGESTPGVDATLEPGGSVTGTVKSGKSGLTGICVTAYQAGTTNWRGVAETSSSGTYTISNLAAGSYDLEFSECTSSENYVTQWYKGASTQSGASPVSVKGGKITKGIDVSMVKGGSIAGVVKYGKTGVSGICVTAYVAGTNTWRASAQTSASGAYTLTGLATGTYDIEYLGCTGSDVYLAQWYQAASTQGAATAVSVTAPKATKDINAALVKGGSITGTVKSGKAPLSGICVTALRAGSGTYGGSAQTGSSGSYTVSGLPTGKYDVEFSDCASAGSYTTQWYKGASTQGAATAVSVTAPKATTDINASLAMGGSISGTVTSGARGLSGICVSAFGTAGSASATTDTSGTYTLTGLASGSYDVEFVDCSNAGSYATQWYDDATTLRTATPVAVSVGTATSGIDATLPSGGTVSGTVDSGGVPLEGVCAAAYRPGTGGYSVSSTGTSTSGSYTLKGLPAGTYDIEFVNCSDRGSYVPQWYKDASTQSSATAVSVEVGATTSGIDATLAVGGTITGAVTSGGTGLSGICVSAYQGKTSLGTVLTSTSGTYTLSGLSTGTYKVWFSNCTNPKSYVGQWYGGTSTASAAASVSVTAGAKTSGIDATLAVGGTITGAVTSGGVGVPGICVGAFRNGVEEAGAQTGTSGTYKVTGLPTGSYDVEFFSCSSPATYVAQWYKDASTQSAATAVSVTAGATSSGIDATLSKSATSSTTSAAGVGTTTA